MERVCIGIDPGTTGAVAFIQPDGSVVTVDTPTVAREVARAGKKPSKRRDYHPAQMAMVLRAGTADVGVPAIAAIEGVQAMRQRRDAAKCPACGRGGEQGVTSAFSFGRGAGLWEGILAGLGIPYVVVYPQRWKRSFDLIGCDKDKARLVVTRLYPAAAAQFARKKDIGRADAALIATYLAQDETRAAAMGLLAMHGWLQEKSL